jgi:type IX secretion system PorP/SprF family membrane protein
MKRICLIATVLVSGVLHAQDPNFSQFYNNPTYYNPAMTGINNGTTLRFNARNLWGPIPGRFNTFAASVDAQSVFKMGLGINAYSDVGGEALLRTTAGYLNYSYRPVDSKNCVLQFGASGGYVNKNIDWSKLKFSDQYDETLGEVRPSAFANPNYQSIGYVDFGAGAVVRFNGEPRRNGRGSFDRFMVTLGGSVHHLSQPKDGFLQGEQQLPLRSIFHGNINLLFDEVVIAPGAVYETQNQFRTFSAGVNFVNKPMTFGLWFRNRTAALTGKQFDSFIFVLGYSAPPKSARNWRVMYNYDITVSRLKTSSYGTHEISLIIDFNNSILFKKMVSNRNVKRRFQCPTDFGGL